MQQREASFSAPFRRFSIDGCEGDRYTLPDQESALRLLLDCVGTDHMVLASDGPAEEKGRLNIPMVRMAYGACGLSRLMCGSDFPPVAGHENHHHAMCWAMEHLACCSENDTAWIVGKTALALLIFAEAGQTA